MQPPLPASLHAPRPDDLPAGPPPPRPIRRAASVIVLRDGTDGLEVLLLRRAEKANDQNSGAAVFPGGVLDAADPRLHACCRGLDDVAASARLGVPSGGLDFHIAAVRECFEEAGLLFATDADGLPVVLDHLAADELALLRTAADQGTDALLTICDARGWHLAADRLVYYTHWLTPPGMPRRFDTRFFVAALPARQAVRPDGRETVEHLWLRPADAIDARAGLKLMNVTRVILSDLQAFATVADCLAHARALREIRMVMPRLADGTSGRRPVNVDEPAYDEVGFIDPDGVGGARHALEPGLVMRLSPRVWRVTAADRSQPDRPGLHSYFVGGNGGDWALIDPHTDDEAHGARLRAAAPGPVRWLLSTTTGRVDDTDAHAAPDTPINLGDATLQPLAPASPTGTWRFLLREEGLLFCGADDVSPMPAGVTWRAPSRGFVRRVGP
ncbi:hypothetical protein BH10PSE18_BH10PSE18_31430 [soil metagenome]